ncbi:MAG TPA: hypothetical protein VMM77_05850 [Gemmatimonadaceae bacterium]|nr:hypothetical protein [Gemmatimonadaceae bacterium]
MRLRATLAPPIAASVVIAIALFAGAVLAAPWASRALQDRFPHDEHAGMFPLCITCHAGAVTQGEPMWPEPSGCASCHDGVITSRIEWAPPAAPRSSNVLFTHESHDRATVAKDPADSALVRECSACHTAQGAPRMAVQHAVVGECIDCHRLGAPHLEVASEACATCHMRLTDARTLSREDIAGFPEPPSHSAPDFLFSGHGEAARGPQASGPQAVAASCATCHSRNLCLTCHVNAPESRVILALEMDERPPVHVASMPVPPSHMAAGFLRDHGRQAQRASVTCATCHTQESCATCHTGPASRVVASLPAAGDGRAAGAQLARLVPPNHTIEFREGHGPEANARPMTCEGCHQRSMCLDCHRPESARQSSFHAQNFLTRHPSAAFAREANCSDCHNPAQFCQSCHQQSGLVANSRIGQAGYHDAFRGFSLGHGQAARQSLESCASCHAERDCTACHSAVGSGFRFNPHGPGFNAARSLSKNPSLCVACHGRAIPGGS